MSSVATNLGPIAPSSARSSAIAILLLALPAICWAAMSSGMEVATGFVMLAFTAVLFRRASRDRFGSSATVVGLFFAGAICHAAVGFVMAGPASISIWIGTAAERVYATAFLVVSTGLLACSAGYFFAIPLAMKRMRSAIRGFRADDARLVQIARLIALSGAALMFAVYAAVGIVPMLADSFDRVRYLSSAGDEFAIYDWLAARALDLLTFSLPLLLVSAFWRRRKLDAALAVVATVAILLPLRRANLLTVVFLVLILGALRTGKFGVRRLAMAGTFVALYALSQLLFVSFASLGDLDMDRGAAIAAGALPEIRDLGWTIELIGEERLQGVTFLQALVPIPSFLSDFSQRDSLRAITSRLIGLDMQRQTGGLRLTLAGEAYLNFDLFGPVLVGFLFGMLCASVENAFREFRDRRALWAYFTAALLFVWTCFWLYLGGTQSAATIKMGLALLAVSLWWAHRNFPHTTDAAFEVST
jgi:hypothetical protein